VVGQAGGFTKHLYVDLVSVGNPELNLYKTGSHCTAAASCSIASPSTLGRYDPASPQRLNKQLTPLPLLLLLLSNSSA
jgi:hypothetical protein